MQKIAKFEKVSLQQFAKDFKYVATEGRGYTAEEIQKFYDNIILPKRGTEGSAGYDIFSPIPFALSFGDNMVVPTGLRCKIEPGWFLDINPRSGQGFKYGIKLANTRGIIDSDYYFANNEGHILINIVNESIVNYDEDDFFIDTGKAFCQGIFTIYGITEDDEATEKRTGGFGSTNA